MPTTRAHALDEMDADCSGEVRACPPHECMPLVMAHPEIGQVAPLVPGTSGLVSDASTRAMRSCRVQVTFEELVKLMYKYATPDEIATMLEWVAKEPEPEPEPKPGLSAESKKQILGIFKIYDKDSQGCKTHAVGCPSTNCGPTPTPSTDEK